MKSKNRFRIFLIFFAALVSDSLCAQERYAVCSEWAEIAAAKLIGYSDNEVARMRGARGVSSLPTFRRSGYPFDAIVQRDYLRDQRDSALIAYASDDTHICAFLITGNQRNPIYVRQKYDAGKLEELSRELSVTLDVTTTWNSRSVRKVRSPLPGKQNVSHPQRDRRAIIRDMSRLFFWPEFRDELKFIRQLSIVPIKGMSAIPIALLEPFDDGRQIVDLFSVNFLTFLADVQNGTMVWPRKFEHALIVGNPRPSDDPEFEWMTLPGAEEEARVIKTLFNGNLLLGNQATRKSVLSSIADADLIYFAAHGYSDASNPIDGSFIVLGDGRLTAREVQSLKLNNWPVVVLSACQTGEGHIMEAGIVGIARAFQIARAYNTVMSLWAVDDAATKVLMSDFAQRLKREPPAEAMRAAMIKLRETDANPAHWAAFNVFGNRAITSR